MQLQILQAGLLARNEALGTCPYLPRRWSSSTADRHSSSRSSITARLIQTPGRCANLQRMGPRLTNLLGQGTKCSAGLVCSGHHAYPPWGGGPKQHPAAWRHRLVLAIACPCRVDLHGSLPMQMRQGHFRSHVFHLISFHPGPFCCTGVGHGPWSSQTQLQQQQRHRYCSCNSTSKRRVLSAMPWTLRVCCCTP